MHRLTGGRFEGFFHFKGANTIKPYPLRVSPVGRSSDKGPVMPEVFHCLQAVAQA